MIAFMSSSRSVMEEVDRSAAKKKGGPSPPFFIRSSVTGSFDLRFLTSYMAQGCSTDLVLDEKDVEPSLQPGKVICNGGC
jgi:hypothetical protein